LLFECKRKFREKQMERQQKVVYPNLTGHEGTNECFYSFNLLIILNRDVEIKLVSNGSNH